MSLISLTVLENIPGSNIKDIQAALLYASAILEHTEVKEAHA